MEKQKERKTKNINVKNFFLYIIFSLCYNTLHKNHSKEKSTMELIKVGKTKDVYRGTNGNIVLRFKDTVTGHASTGESDPGGNQVVGEKAGVGAAALKMTSLYFEMLKKLKIPTHFVSSDLEKQEMTVRPAVPFGNGLEFVVRYKAAGSFVKRFGAFCKEGDNLPAVFEMTLKDDNRDDPPVTPQILEALKLMTKKQVVESEKLAIKVCDIVKNDLAKKGMDLIDIKVEVGLVDGKVALIDEISGGNMRVEKDGKLLDYVSLSDRL